MVVLDHRRIVEPHPVIGRAAHPGRVFFKHAQAGDRLARIEQRRPRARDGVDISASHGGDAGEVLDGIERRAFGGQHRPCQPRQSH